MQTPPLAVRSRHLAMQKFVLFSHRRRAGVALVLVLGMLVLLMVLVVAFFTRVTTEVVGAKASASNLRSRQLAASAVQLVQGTITNATEPRETTTTAWACQPGMIRTFGTGTSASSAPYKYYKLYSSDTMVVTADTNPAVTNFSPSSDLDALWDKKPAYFTDLNAPIANATNPSDVIFPIADPRATDPSTPVEGFSYTAGVDGVVQVSSGTNTARLPMPVRWLYVLRDGTLTCPDIASASTTVPSATFTANIPTKNNPIVGRIAFWTDDESAKVNLNTASEGTYWDTPVANTGKSPDSFSYPQTTAIGDVLLATYQGAQHEYQRYPGHPATTCLSTVLGSALGGLSRNDLVQAITNAIPRVTDTAGQSSMGGTAAPNTANLTTDLDRLYASVDEFAFKPPASTDTTRTVQAVGSGSTVQNVIERTRFFLTSSSKAPELNLFGLPRVAMWPVWDDSHASKRTSFDNAILRCATVANSATAGNQHPMIFERSDPASATKDFSIKRNQQVYSYLSSLMSEAIPGFGGNFLTKYGPTDQTQILTEIFDYIRCTNLADQSDATLNHTYTPSFLPSAPNLNVAVGQVVPTQGGGANAGGTSHGFGRIGTVAELALVLDKIDDRFDTSLPEGPSNQAAAMTISGDTPVNAIDPSKQTLMEWSLIPKFFCPMAGYAGLGNDFRLRFVINNLKIGDAPVITKALGSLSDEFDTGRLPSGGRDAVIGGLMGIMFPIWGGGPSTSLFPTGLCAVTGTNALSGSYNGGTIPVSGSVDVLVYAPNTATTNPIQTLHFQFPAANPVPIPVTTYWSGSSATGTFRNSSWSANKSAHTVTFSYNTTNSSHGGSRRWDPSLYHFIGDSAGGPSGKETVRTLVPTGTINGIAIGGDMRMIASSSTVPAEAWKLAQINASSGTLNVSGGTDPTAKDYQVSSMRMSPYFSCASADNGSLIPLLKSPKSLVYGRKPEIPPGVSAAMMASTDNSVPGDWDNGPGIMIDGPFVNKPDEGESPVKAGSGIPYVGPSETTSNYQAAESYFFSPNKQVSSPVMLGSLTVGVDHPWRTLCFRPGNLPGYQDASVSGGYQHPGRTDSTIPDHLMLDLFSMPVVEPYSISEPLATAGKINLNTQIAPFTYITRNTGMRAVLKSVMITALNPAQSADPSGKNLLIHQYKNGYDTATGYSENTTATSRYPIDADQTLNQLTTNSTGFFPVFNRTTNSARLPNFFVAASQICDVPLIPSGYTTSNLSTFWSANGLTGDNSLERPYSMIYSRVTTKSNTFTVHVRAQSLQQAVNGTPSVWREDRDQVTGEYRGAFTIEKYYDPNTANITDSSGNALANSEDANLSAHSDAAVRGTRWRLVDTKQFGQ